MHPLVGSWSLRPDWSFMNPWTLMFWDSSSSDDVLRHSPTKVPHQRSSGREKVLKLTTFFPSRDCSALTATLKPLAVDGMTIKFSPLSWADRPSGQDARNQPRKARVSRTPVIKMNVLYGRSPAGRRAFFTWAC